jgi:hypothetical protein
MTPPAAITFEDAKGPLAKRSMKAGPRLSKAVSSACETSADRIDDPKLSTSISSDTRGFRRRLTRRPNAAGCADGGGANSGSSGAIRLVRPNSSSTPFSSVAPSPNSHDEVARAGDVGVDVTIAAPGGGSVTDPALAGCPASTPM